MKKNRRNFSKITLADFRRRLHKEGLRPSASHASETWTGESHTAKWEIVVLRDGTCDITLSANGRHTTSKRVPYLTAAGFVSFSNPQARETGP